MMHNLSYFVFIRERGINKICLDNIQTKSKDYIKGYFKTIFQHYIMTV